MLRIIFTAFVLATMLAPVGCKQQNQPDTAIKTGQLLLVTDQDGFMNVVSTAEICGISVRWDCTYHTVEFTNHKVQKANMAYRGLGMPNYFNTNFILESGATKTEQHGMICRGDGIWVEMVGPPPCSGGFRIGCM